MKIEFSFSLDNLQIVYEKDFLQFRTGSMNSGKNFRKAGVPIPPTVFFFSMWVFFNDHSRITALQGKGEGISLTPHYHFHPLHRHLDISRVITAKSSPLHIETLILVCEFSVTFFLKKTAWREKLFKRIMLKGKIKIIQKKQIKKHYSRKYL